MYNVTYVNMYGATPDNGHLRLHRRLHDGLSSPPACWSTAPATTIRRTSCRARCRSTIHTRTPMPAASGTIPPAAHGRVAAPIYGPYGGAVTRAALLQSGDRRLGAWRRGIWPIWRCRCLVGLQPHYRHVRARQRRLGRRRRHRQCQLLQPTLRRVGLHDAERQRLFALGLQHDQRPEPDREHGERQQRARLGWSDSAPPPGPRAPACTPGQATTRRSGAPPAATSMLAPTATPTSRPTDGWSKWDNGGWQPAKTSTDSRSASTANRQPLNTGSYQQLDQDRFARSQGAWGGRQFEAPEGRYFGGGGRFRR